MESWLNAAWLKLQKKPALAAGRVSTGDEVLKENRLELIGIEFDPISQLPGEAEAQRSSANRQRARNAVGPRIWRRRTEGHVIKYDLVGNATESNGLCRS